MSNNITIPVRATMRRQPDGSYKMCEAERVTVDADVVARFILERLGVDYVDTKTIVGGEVRAI